MMKSAHAQVRTQQRGIPPLVVDLLMQFGTRINSGEGTEICFFDRRARKHIHAYAGGLFSRLNEQLDAYAVVSGEKVVTVGTRYKKLNRN